MGLQVSEYSQRAYTKHQALLDWPPWKPGDATPSFACVLAFATKWLRR